MNAQSNLAAPSLFVGSRLMVFSLASLVAVAGARWLSDGGWGLWLSVAAILLAIWHGAFDGVLAEKALTPRFGARWRLPFYAAYLSLGAVVLLLWWNVPVIALSAFLLYSAFHFGTEAERDLSPERLVTGLAAGFVPIAAACHWWPQQVADDLRAHAAPSSRLRRSPHWCGRPKSVAGRGGRRVCSAARQRLGKVHVLDADRDGACALPRLLPGGGLRALLLPVAHPRAHAEHQSGQHGTFSVQTIY